VHLLTVVFALLPLQVHKLVDSAAPESHRALVDRGYIQLLVVLSGANALSGH
jgi:hypothetical protein